MTPKEKAQQLADNMFIEMSSFSVTDEVLETVAKQCALIAVDEIFNSGLLVMLDDEQYWYDVQKEIEKL